MGYFEFHLYVMWLAFIMALVLLVVYVPQALLGDGRVQSTEDASLLERIIAGQGDWENTLLFYGYVLRRPIPSCPAPGARSVLGWGVGAVCGCGVCAGIMTAGIWMATSTCPWPTSWFCLS